MSARGRYFVAGVIARWKKQRLQLLVMNTKIVEGPRAGERSLKFPGGMEESQDNGNPEKTLRAEIEEETGLRIRDNAIVSLLSKVSVEDHDKYFFLVWKRDCEGARRTKTIKDGNTVLYPPHWADLEFLKPVLYRTHRLALEKLTF